MLLFPFHLGERMLCALTPAFSDSGECWPQPLKARLTSEGLPGDAGMPKGRLCFREALAPDKWPSQAGNSLDTLSHPLCECAVRGCKRGLRRAWELATTALEVCCVAETCMSPLSWGGTLNHLASVRQSFSQGCMAHHSTLPSHTSTIPS